MLMTVTPELTAHDFATLALDVAVHGVKLERPVSGFCWPGHSTGPRVIQSLERGEWRVESDPAELTLRLYRNGKFVWGIDRRYSRGLNDAVLSRFVGAL